MTVAIYCILGACVALVGFAAGYLLGHAYGFQNGIGWMRARYIAAVKAQAGQESLEYEP